MAFTLRAGVAEKSSPAQSVVQAIRRRRRDLNRLSFALSSSIAPGERLHLSPLCGSEMAFRLEVCRGAVHTVEDGDRAQMKRLLHAVLVESITGWGGRN